MTFELIASHLRTARQTLRLFPSYDHGRVTSSCFSSNSLRSQVLLRLDELAVGSNRFVARRTFFGTSKDTLEPPQVTSSNRRSISSNSRPLHSREIPNSIWAILEQIPEQFGSSSLFPVDLRDHVRHPSCRIAHLEKPRTPFFTRLEFNRSCHFRSSISSIDPRYDPTSFASFIPNPLPYMVHQIAHSSKPSRLVPLVNLPFIDPSKSQ